jgi:hypothetical protein
MSIRPMSPSILFQEKGMRAIERLEMKAHQLSILKDLSGRDETAPQNPLSALAAEVWRCSATSKSHIGHIGYIG